MCAYYLFIFCIFCLLFRHKASNWMSSEFVGEQGTERNCCRGQKRVDPPNTQMRWKKRWKAFNISLLDVTIIFYCSIILYVFE